MAIAWNYSYITLLFVMRLPLCSFNFFARPIFSQYIQIVGKRIVQIVNWFPGIGLWWISFPMNKYHLFSFFIFCVVQKVFHFIKNWFGFFRLFDLLRLGIGLFAFESLNVRFLLANKHLQLFMLMKANTNWCVSFDITYLWCIAWFVVAFLCGCCEHWNVIVIV